MKSEPKVDPQWWRNAVARATGAPSLRLAGEGDRMEGWLRIQRAVARCESEKAYAQMRVKRMLNESARAAKDDAG